MVVLAAAILVLGVAGLAAYLLRPSVKDSSSLPPTPKPLTDPVAKTSAPAQPAPDASSSPAVDVSVPPDLPEDQQIAWITEKELALAQRLVEDFPDRDDALVAMGNVHRELGQTAQAQEYWTRALALNPDRPDACDGLAMIAMERGEHDQAVRYWTRALQIDPSYPQLRTSIAQALIRQGLHDQALAILQQETEYTPYSANAHYLLGQEYLRRKDYEQARAAYERAIACKPDHTNAHFGLFTACLRLKRTDQAEKHRAEFERLKAQDMKNLKNRNLEFDDLSTVRTRAAQTCLAAASLYASRPDPPLAQSYLEQAAALAPDDTECLMRLAAIYRRNGRVGQALQAHRTIAERDPENVMNWYNMGGLLVQMKQLDQAESAFRTVTTLAPQLAGGHRELARSLLLQNRQCDQALAAAQKAVALEPGAMNYYVLSWAWDKNGNKPGALAAIRRAVELEPDNAEYQRMARLAETAP